MKEKTKPQYSIFQNLIYSASQVWQLDRLLYALTISDIILGLLLNLIQLYIAPVILQKVEQSVPLAELIFTIGIFTLALLLCNSAKQYLVYLAFISDSRLTSGMVLAEIRKACTTSFPNLLDNKFQEKHIAAIHAIYQNNNGAVGQLLDVMDYISNSFLMPAISMLTCIFVGWVAGPQIIVEEMERTGDRFTRKRLYCFMIRYVAPVIMAVLFLQSTGLLSVIF